MSPQKQSFFFSFTDGFLFWWVIEESLTLTNSWMILMEKSASFLKSTKLVYINVEWYVSPEKATYSLFWKGVLIKRNTICGLLQSQNREAFFLLFL